MQCAINVILSIKAKTDSTIISEIYMIWIANFVSKYFSTSYFHILLFIYLIYPHLILSHCIVPLPFLPHGLPASL